MWKLDRKEGWEPKNWCFWTVVLEKILESPLDCKKLKPVNPKGNQPRISIVKTDAESQAPMLQPPDWRTEAFKLRCWRRLLGVPWTARRSNQSILKEINPEYYLEGLMLKLKLQHWLPDMKSWLIRKDPDAGNGWRQKEKGTTEDEMVE